MATTYSAEVEVRFRDFDPMGHVNNAIYVTYLERARADFYEEVVGVRLGEIDTVLVDLGISYERPIDHVGTVVVDLDVGEVGRSSIPMEYEIRPTDGGDRYATAETVQVFFDSETGESTRLPDRYRDRMT